MIRQVITQFREEFGTLALLGNCVLIPTSLIILFALCGVAGAFDQ